MKENQLGYRAYYCFLSLGLTTSFPFAFSKIIPITSTEFVIKNDSHNSENVKNTEKTSGITTLKMVCLRI